MNPDVDGYIERSEAWPEEMTALRPVLLETGLIEEIKWRLPCYTHRGKNVVIMQEMKDFLSLMFFKGALLADPDGLLEEQGPNSRAARRLTFTSVDDVRRLAGTVTAYVAEAIAIEESGRQVDPGPALVLVEELQHRLDQDPELRAAFAGLTPGRQREYHLHISGAKQTATRQARVERLVPRILAGKGLRDR